MAARRGLQWSWVYALPLLPDSFQLLTSSFPDAGQCLPQLLIRDVQVALRGPDVGVSEHQLDGSDVDALRQEAAGAFVSQVVPVQVDLPELLASHADARLGALDRKSVV